MVSPPEIELRPVKLAVIEDFFVQASVNITPKFRRHLQRAVSRRNLRSRSKPG